MTVRVVEEAAELPSVRPRRVQAEDRDAVRGPGLLPVDAVGAALDLHMHVAADGLLHMTDGEGVCAGFAGGGLAAARRGASSTSLNQNRFATSG